MSEERIIEDPAHPGWRARLRYDEDHPQPWGDALAPALLVHHGRHPQATLAADVYQPKNGSDITSAWRHFADADLFERYLRIAHGATNVSRLDRDDMTVILYDTNDFRAYTGYTGTCDLSGETAQWQAWLDGEVYGVHIQSRPLAPPCGTTAAPNPCTNGWTWKACGACTASTTRALSPPNFSARTPATANSTTLVVANVAGALAGAKTRYGTERRA